MKILYLLLIVWVVLIIVLRADVVAAWARIQWQRGNSEKALKAYAFADKIGKMSADSCFAYGYIALRHGDTEVARRVLTRASMSNPKPPAKKRIKSMLALLEWKEGNLSLAIEMLEEIIEDFKTTEMYQDLGLMYILSGDKEKALDFNLEAYEYNSDNMGIMDNLAQSYILCGEQEKAAEIYEELLEKEPHFPEPYYEYGVMLVEKGERERGIDLIRKSLDKRFTFLSVKSKEEVKEFLDRYEV